MPRAKSREEERGVASEPGLSAWSVLESDFPREGGTPSKIAFLLRYAILAPSSHNTQPWLFRIAGDNAVELYADRARALPVVDPDDRALVISCGAALCHLRLAASHFGLSEETVDLLPDEKNNPDLIARITFEDKGGEPDTNRAQHDAMLFAAITKRRSNRSPFENRELPGDLLLSLKDIARAYGSWLDIAKDMPQKNALADLISQGDKVQMADKKFRRELAAWIHPNRSHTRDGMPGYAFGMPDVTSYVGPFLMRTFDMGKGQAAKDRQLAAGSPVLAVLGTDGDGPLDWIHAGEAIAKILLLARADDVWASFMNQPIEVPELRPRVREALGRSSGFAQLLVRMGYGGAVKPTPRRDVKDVIL